MAIGGGVQREVFTAYRFFVTVPGLNSLSAWMSIGGLSQETKVKTYERCNDIEAPLKVPGGFVPGDIVLSKGLTEDRSLANWFHAVHENYEDLNTLQTALPTKTDVVIEYSRREYSSGELATYEVRLKNAWPSRFEVAGVNAKEGGLLMNTMTLTCDEIDFLGR